MLEVLKLFVASRNASINEVHFPAELGPSFVYATPEAINEAVKQFLGDRSQRRPARLARRAAKKRQAGQEEGRQEGQEEEEAEEAEGRSRKPPGSDGLVPAARSRRSRGEDRRPASVGGGFPVFYPTRLPSGACYVESNPYEHVQ